MWSEWLTSEADVNKMIGKLSLKSVKAIGNIEKIEEVVWAYEQQRTS